MPIYTYHCPCCGTVQEKIQGMNEVHALTCDNCDLDMDRIWDIPAFQGDLPQTKGGFKEFYDHESGLIVTGRKMWEDVKRRTGRVQWEPDPESDAARREERYIMKHSKPGDKDAARAAHKTLRDTEKRKIERRAKETTEAHKKRLLRELPNPGD